MKLLLAISGGIDSTVLLDTLATGRLGELGVRDNELTTHELTVCYFHHGTPHADDAEAFVHTLAEKYNLPLEVGRTTERFTSEAAFRDARYTFLRATKTKLRADRIVTAHHADDQAETVLLNLTRGSGLTGLSGMRADTGELLRPFLGVSKRDIEAYAARHSLTWVDDPTNAEGTFARNRIRHTVIPGLAAINPRVIETITRTAERLRDVDAFLNATADDWLATHAVGSSLPLDAFGLLPDSMKTTLIRRIHHAALGHTRRLEEIHIDDVLTLAQSGIGGKQKTCGELTFQTTRDDTGHRILTWCQTAKMKQR